MATSTRTSCGRGCSYGPGLAMVAGLVPVGAATVCKQTWHLVTSRVTWRGGALLALGSFCGRKVCVAHVLLSSRLVLVVGRLIPSELAPQLFVT